MNTIKQFKLTTGEEVLCEVVEWADEENEDLVVKHTYRVNTYQQPNSMDRYHTLVPWMVSQDDSDMFQVINANHIVGEANPSTTMLAQFFKVVNSFKSAVEDVSEDKATEQISRYLNNLKQMLSDVDGLDDSDGNKVIRFPSRDRLH